MKTTKIISIAITLFWFFALIVACAKSDSLLLIGVVYVSLMLNCVAVAYVGTDEHNDAIKESETFVGKPALIVAIVILLFASGCGNRKIPCKYHVKIGSVLVTSNEVMNIKLLAKENGFCKPYILNREPDGALLVVSEFGEIYELKNEYNEL